MSALVEQLQQHAQTHPQRTALIVPQLDKTARLISFGDLSRRVGEFVAELAGRLDQPAIIPIIASKNESAVIAMFAVLASGSAFASLNRKLKSPQIRSILDQSYAPFVIVDPQCRSLVGDAAVVQIPEAEHPPESSADFIPAPESADSVGCCLFTSGSTGVPKGVLIAESDLFARAKSEVACFGLTADDVLLCVLPFSFDVGLNQLLSAIVAGCTIVLSESWLPADILRNAARFNVTGISAVPSIWNDLLNSGLRFNTADEHRALRYMTVSGGDMPVERLQQLQTVIGSARIIKTYGQSETFRSTALLPQDFASKPASVGKALPSVRVYVARADGTLASSNEPGEIIHTGMGTMLGYLDADNREKLRPNPFHSPEDPAPLAVFTGDFGTLDEDGFLYVHGRKDAMLKVAGNRVYPKEIADQIATLANVEQVEVIGKKNGQGDTDIHAFVVSSGGTLLDLTELRRQVMRLLPSYMVPRHIHLITELPRTASGKTDRPALIAQL